MIEFKRDKETGILEAWKDKKKIGKVVTIGDKVTENINNKSSEGYKNDKYKGKSK